MSMNIYSFRYNHTPMCTHAVATVLYNQYVLLVMFTEKQWGIPSAPEPDPLQ